ncbi:uncharacterized protein LOC115634315 [Scaptodrosophila lebanonensis]|uniref:Uncharacterized protein LOC115634315 n=1 Tax=Drosophila lebanonensis TaxID=7225 RepID=A0A6J2UI59_DROLE|nr:uncharacterized protein LOC115634315 [Scaptodrosophila lebanonensis]
MSQDKQKIAKFHHDLQNNEVRTMHYLGLAYLVLARTPELQVKVPLSTLNYEDGDDVGFAVQVVFTCPPNYPLLKPKVDIVEKRNLPMGMETAMREEITVTLEQHVGLQMMVPVVTRLQMLMNGALRRLPAPRSA